MSVREDLQGARLSSAVRCVARAEHEALGSPRDEHAQTLLRDAFVRGVNVADAWVERQAKLCAEQGKELVAEAGIPWGPPEWGWQGHADALILEDKLVIEAYHAKGGDFRRYKALQAAAYASLLGDGWRAMLAVLDSTDIDEDEGFAVTLIPLEVETLAVETNEILTRVITAVGNGSWNPDDRVADSPHDNECRHCPFRTHCWEGYVPPLPTFAPELDDLAVKLAALKADRAQLEVQVDQIAARERILRDELRPYAQLGVPLVAGGVSIKRIEVKPRRTFKFAAYEGAGHIVTPTMRDFLSEAKESGERWYIGKVQ